MNRLAFVILLAACGGKQTSSTTAPSGEPAIAKRVVVGFGFSPGEDPAKTSVYLAVTDETGKQVSHPVGSYEGTCRGAKPGPEMNALVGASCTSIDLHAVVQGSEIIVMGAKHAPDSTAPIDPMAREEVTRVAFPLGAAVDAAP